MGDLVFRSSFHKYRKIFRAIIARIILASHSWIAICFTLRFRNEGYILLVISVLIFLFEGCFILYKRKGCEWKRFCTSFLCYLVSIVPSLWILRFHIAEVKHDTKAESPHNDTRPRVLAVKDEIPLPHNNTVIADIFEEENIPSVFEQSMMFIIIIVRWLLPRGRIDRNSLSQLLIMYSAIGADILDFSEIFDNSGDTDASYFNYIVLGVWSWSLLQFTFVVTTSFSFKRRQGQQNSTTNQQTDNNRESESTSETISILMVFLMQDGPFLVTRCYAIYSGVVNYLILFFSFKNLLTIVLGLYRLCVLCGCVSVEGNDLLSMQEIAQSMESLDNITEVRVEKRGKREKY